MVAIFLLLKQPGRTKYKRNKTNTKLLSKDFISRKRKRAVAGTGVREGPSS